jgi:hypothetical protein
MDTLSIMVTPPKLEEPEGEKRGRPKELKSYIIENNSELYPEMQLNDKSYAIIENTGVENIKRLTIRQDLRHVQFYLDVSDPEKRFLILHTSFDAEETQDAIKQLIFANDFEFDNAWLSTSSLKAISRKVGNRQSGYKIGYKDIFQDIKPEEILPENSVVLEGSGGISNKLLQLAENDPSTQRTLGYERIRISRGSIYSGVLTDLSYDGRFIVRKGRSIGDEMVLVDGVKEDYANQIKEIENLRIRGERKGGFSSIEGVPFEFEFRRDVDDWETFLPKIFNGKEPFKIWGIKSKIRDGYYRVLGVDMHTGHPIDVEVSNHLIRAYLPQGSCGNVILRLLVNLQISFDSTTTCSQLS